MKWVRAEIPRQRELLLHRPSRNKAQQLIKTEYFLMAGAYSVREGRRNEGDERNKLKAFHKEPWNYVDEFELYPKNNNEF